MNRLRCLALDYLLPLVIGALVLRALIPVGFMPAGTPTSLTAPLCNAPATGNPGTEVIEIPGGDGALTHTHCDFCFLPVMAAASSPASMSPPSAVQLPVRGLHAPAPVSRFALARAQIPRAPPLA